MEKLSLDSVGKVYDASARSFLFRPGRGDQVIDYAVRNGRVDVEFAPYDAITHYLVDAIPGAPHLFTVNRVDTLVSRNHVSPLIKTLIKIKDEVESEPQVFTDFVCEDGCEILTEEKFESPLASSENLN